MAKGNRKGVPERWERYSPIGSRIEGTPFIAFKVPLSKALNLKNQSEATEDGDYNAETWTLEELFVRRPDLDAVVDLTNTKRYYDPRDMERAAPKGDDFAYFKIFTQGHEVPNRDVVGRFYDAVDTVLSRNRDALVGVHCTHGANRTGYLICRYLIERLEWDPDRAIKAFGESRGHPCERQNYLDDLRRASWNRHAQAHYHRAERGGGRPRRSGRGGGGAGPSRRGGDHRRSTEPRSGSSRDHRRVYEDDQEYRQRRRERYPREERQHGYDRRDRHYDQPQHYYDHQPHHDQPPRHHDHPHRHHDYPPRHHDQPPRHHGQGQGFHDDGWSQGHRYPYNNHWDHPPRY